MPRGPRRRPLLPGVYRVTAMSESMWEFSSPGERFILSEAERGAHLPTQGRHRLLQLRLSGTPAARCATAGRVEAWGLLLPAVTRHAGATSERYTQAVRGAGRCPMKLLMMLLDWLFPTPKMRR